MLLLLLVIGLKFASRWCGMRNSLLQVMVSIAGLAFHIGPFSYDVPGIQSPAIAAIAAFVIAMLLLFLLLLILYKLELAIIFHLYSRLLVFFNGKGSTDSLPTRFIEKVSKKIASMGSFESHAFSGF